MRQQILLLEDVEGLGRSGDIVAPKPGYTRNFLLPQKKAVIAGPRTLKWQARLQEERLQQAAKDREESEKLAAILETSSLEFIVKVDPENNMYGSVTIADMIDAAANKGIVLNRKNFPNAHFAIKSLGNKKVLLKLKEGVLAHLYVEVRAETQLNPANNA